MSKGPRNVYFVLCSSGRFCHLPGGEGWSWEDCDEQPYLNRREADAIRRSLDVGEDGPARCGPHRVVKYSRE